MYCKHCGHRFEGKAETCPKCGAKLATAVELGPAAKSKPRWTVLAAAAIIGVIVFVVFPRVFLRTGLEPIGPTNKARFLRALGRSEYRGVGQREFRVEGQTLVVMWDLRWNTLPDSKQQDVIRIVGRAWEAVGGEDTRLQIEGEDNAVASYSKGEIHLGPSTP